MNKKELRRKFSEVLNRSIMGNCLSYESIEKLLSLEAVIPIENDSFRGGIEGNDGINNVEDYLITKEPSFLEKHEDFKKLIDNGYFNPYKYYQLSEYYVKPKGFKNLDTIYDLLTKPKIKRNIVLIGEKGSGKTAAQNIWLNENNTKLEDLGVFWVRCDGHKLYKLWLGHQQEQERKNKDVEITRLVHIEEYIQIQVLYVFSKYCMSSERPFLNKLFQKIENDKDVVAIPDSREHINVTKEYYLHSAIEDLHKVITKDETSQPNSYSHAFDNVMKVSLDTKQLNKRKWLAISAALQEKLTGSNYKILKIVDGIDNVHINDDRSKVLYRHMINGASKFLKYHPRKNIFHMLVMRERTYIDACQHPIQQDTGDYIKDFTIKVGAPEFKDVIGRRYDYAIDNIFKGDETYDKIASNVIDGINDNINGLHHNNIREFLYNKMSLISLTYYRLRQVGYSNVDIKKYVRFLEERNKFLNGRLFLRTISDWHHLNNELGLCCMNMFSCEPKDYTALNRFMRPLLCPTRLLQILQRNDSAKHNDLIEFCSIRFGYHKANIELSLDNLRAFGMIDSGYDSEIYYTMSEKGKAYLVDTFTSQDFLYYFALDTVAPKAFLSNEFYLPRINKIGRSSNYPSSTIVTATSFLLFLNCLNSFEEQYFSESVMKNALTINLTLEQIRLPFHNKSNYKKILRSGRELIKSANENDVKIISKYLAAILDLINGPDKWMEHSQSRLS